MWRKLYFHNELLEQGVRRLLRSGLVKINPDTGLIELLDASRAMEFDANWLFFGYNTALRDCYLWHQVMFNHFNQFVPEFCKLRCYKVVVKTRNFLDAMNFYGAIHAAPLVRRDLMPLQGKVGIDERFYTHGHFNGFVYCDGLEDALEKYETVRELLDTQIDGGSDIPVIIKRSCTEFERAHGPTDTDYWQRMTSDELDFQHHLEDMLLGMWGSSTQPDWMKNHVISRMIRWANTIGDTSWVEYVGGNDFLTMHAVTYHHLYEAKKEELPGNVPPQIAPPKPKQKRKESNQKWHKQKSA